MSGRWDRGRGGGRRGGGGGRGRLAPGMRPVDESTRIDIATTLADFQASDATEYAFPPGLSNHDRAVVHAECKKYGFTSKSFGKGETRAVTVFKRRERREGDPIFELPLGEISQAQLSQYFAAYPPTQAELAAAAASGLDQAYADEGTGGSGSSGDEEEEEESGTGKTEQQQKRGGGAGAGKKDVHGSRKVHKGRGGRHAAHFDASEVERRRERWESAISRDSMQTIIAARQSLPIASFREEIVDAVRSNQVILIAGETGCGKTTQVPQYLLEDSWYRQEGCRIVCTQPRRISAMSVAERVASERGESIGDNVGYTIRLESRGGSECSLMFCTNGILLRMLTDRSHDAMSRVTHLIIDEIHERDRFADFLLILVRDLLPAHPHLRVVLMSATLHVELFSGYFGGCPVVRVPGFTHPVQDFYLEDVLKLSGYEAAAVEEIENALGGSSGGRGAAALLGGAGGRRGYRHISGPGGAGGGTAAAGVSAEERQKVEAAIEAAFRSGDDTAFEELMEVTGAAGADESGIGAPCINIQHSVTGATALVAAAFWGRADVATVLLANGADPGVATNNGMTARDCAAQCNRVDVVELLEEWEAQARAADELASSALALSHYQSNTDADEVDLDLIEALLSYICGEGKFAQGAQQAQQDAAAQGAVLIFFPGWDEIIRMKEKLESSPVFGRTSRYLLLPLHSMVAPQEQRKVFARPPPGVRKIVMSTNMAETAITIDDVVCVIDSGRLKEKSYDAFTGVSTLQGAWISKASEKQRRGRAGRCQPGVAFHMYSRQRSEALAEFQLPELKRSPLDEMCLQVKLLEQPGARVSIAEFLGKAVEPPVAQAVEAAVSLLTDIGALDSEERLTSLGRHLAALPLPPALGKMLLYGVLYRCLDPVLTVACCMAYRDPWVLPASPDGRYQAALLRGQWSTEAGGSSDHLATVRAFNGWVASKARGGDHSYCVQNFLSPATMRMIDGMRTQLLGELTSRGFVGSLEEGSSQGHRADLVRAVLGCGFYPMIGRLVPVPARDTKARTSVVTHNGDRVRIHPASTNSKLRVEKPEDLRDDDDEGPPPPQFAALLFFDEITRGDSMLYIKSCTAMHPHPVALVAASIIPAPDTDITAQDDDMTEGVQSMQLGDGNGTADPPTIPTTGQVTPTEAAAPDTGLLIVDGWLKFRVPIQAVAQLSCLRVRVASAFASKVRSPQTPLPPALQGAIDISGSLFINESESADGIETDLGTSYSAGAGRGRGGRGGGYPSGGGFRGGRGGGTGGRYSGGGGGGQNHGHHLFRYSHHGPPAAAHPGRGGRGSTGTEEESYRGGRISNGNYRGRGRGYGGSSGGRGGRDSNYNNNYNNNEQSEAWRGPFDNFQPGQPPRQQPYRGPYAPLPPPGADAHYSGDGGGGRHGVKRSHSGNPRMQQPQQHGGRGGGGGNSGGGSGRGFGGASDGLGSYPSQGRGRGGGGREGGGGRRGGRRGKY